MAISAYFTDTVVWNRYQGRDRWGDEQPPVVDSIRCRVERKQRLARDWRGAEANGGGDTVASSANILMARKPNIQDTFEFDGREYAVLSWEEHRSFGKHAHYKVFLS